MYYRYEIQDENGEWEGIFSIADPEWRRYIGRYIAEPTWYKKQKNPYDAKSRCWFTEYGFKKYHHLIDEMIDDVRSQCQRFERAMKTRLLCAENLENLVMKGKVQVIELLQ